ncbi:CBU_0592 family membrane protein [Flavobacterium sp. RSSA_27]|uniref:CBU_0592 family membrane protein n=1 Tax=Flavobacterium sp. RSSA_27 TaxID=3447667 RepID=UPI003F36C5AD
MNYNDIIGAIGVGIILIAYFLNIFSLIPKEGKLYFLLNILGATIACYASLLINYFPFVILEGTWALVSGYALFQLYNKKR